VQVLTLDSRTDLVLSIRKDWPLLVTAINKVLTALDVTERVAIKRRYLPPPAETAGEPGPVVVEAQELAWLQGRGNRLTYCFHPAWPPYDYLEAGTHRGLFRDFLELFARKLGVQLEPVPAGSWPEALQLAEERRCDLITGAVWTPERERYLRFTRPYIELPLVLVGRDEAPFVAGIEDLPGEPLGVPKGSAIVTSLRARFPERPLLELDGIGDFGEAIASGWVYAAVTTLDNAAELVDTRLGRFRIVGKLDEPAQIAVAVRSDAPQLLALMEKAVDATSAAERDAITGRRTTFKLQQELDLTRLFQVLGVLGVLGLFLGYRHYELSRLTGRLAAAKEAAERANVAKSDFLAVMSHEIRTPLTAVLNLAELGARGGEPGRLKGYLEEIERSGRSLLAVVNEILDLSRLEGSGDVLREAPFVLSDLVGRVVAIAGPLAARKGLELRISVDPQLDEQWLGDTQKIERVLVNLIGNAVKFTDQGRVELTVRRLDAEGKAPKSAAAQGMRIAFEVRDTGIGIDPEDLPDLFSPFHQADNSLSRRHGGTGLGLAIVERLVDLMGGRVEVEAQPGDGSLFRVLLPLVSGGATLTSPDTRAPSGSELGVAHRARRRTQGPPRVLVVEDSGVNRQIVSDFLGRLGLRAETVEDGAEALRRLGEDPRGFDLVLMDVQMPGLDGYETTRRLRSDPRLADLPVLAMTAHVLAEDQQRCQDAGMDDHVAKPFDLTDFARTLGRWLGLELEWRGAGSQTATGPAEGLEKGAPAAPGLPEAGAWINRALGVERIGGDPELFDRMLEEFQCAYAPKLALLEAEGEATDGRALRRIAHMLRGTVPLLGADRLAALAAAVDDELSQDRAPAPGAAAELKAGLAAVLEEARRMVAGGSQVGELVEPHDEKAPPRVLIIEDDGLSAALLAELLGEDFRVSIAPNGTEGLSSARKAPPDLILLDVVMDPPDGYAVCWELKADPETRDIPVIFVTGLADAEDERRGLELGAVDYIHKPFQRRVVQARVRNHVAAKRQGDDLIQLSLLDSLTGLPNRRRLDAYLASVWEKALSDRDSIGLLMIDVDHFKAYNDHYGHAAGDDCLRRVALALQDVCQRGRGLVGRYGGEEFLWVMPGADLGDARGAAGSALEAVRELAIPHGAPPGGSILTLSVGVWVCRPRHGDLLEDCVAQADQRLYRAKSEGRDRIAA
jgi:diguanylate cyclase (GGDEF)-like protein